MEDASPYKAPDTLPSAAPAPIAVQVRLPTETTRPITIMWAVALILAAISLAGVVYAAIRFAKMPEGSLPPLSVALVAGGLLFDVCLYLATAWGVRRRSRVAACVLLGYYLLGQTLTFVSGQRALGPSLFMTLIVAFVMILGTLETFNAHRYVARARQQPPRPRLSDDPAFAPKPAAGE
ncbi:hypothetical protein [Stenotrophomonas sp.]|uniref:hypothetical protein n=1 Tax=Stenotrophomonas sp. TaxID=69392 RepID=UPI002FCAB0F4